MEKQRMDGYIRVSAVKGRSGPSYISPTAQREAIERWAAYQDIEIAEWHVDEDWSGGTQNRPGLELAIERALAGETNGIVSATIDRFSRFTEGGLRDLRRLQERGARLAFVAGDSTIDTTGPQGKAFFTMLLVMSELVLDQIKAAWITAKTKAVDRGAYISRTPFGYKRHEAAGRDDPLKGTIAPHPVDGPLVVEAYRLAGTDGVHAAVEHLKRRAPDRVWTTTTVRRMLARRVYLGETDIGKFSGKTHDPLVSEKAWSCAQTSPDQYQRRLPSAEYPLSGLARCGNCGQPMIGGHGGKDHKLRYYRCAAVAGNRAKALIPCTSGVVITADRLEGYVREQADALLANIRATIGGSDDEIAASLRKTVEEAEEGLEYHSTNDLLRRVMRPEVFDRIAEERAATIEAARAAERDHALKAQARRVLRGGELLDTTFPVMVRGLFESIVVSPGRGLRVEQRVGLVPLDCDSPAGKLSA